MKAPLISLAISAGLLLLAFSVCGVGSAVAGSHADGIAMAGLILFGLSILGGLISLIWLLIAAIRQGSRP